MKLAYILNTLPHRGLYPADRAVALLSSLKPTNFEIFVHNSNTSLIQYLKKQQIQPLLYRNNSHLIEEMKVFDPTCIMHDGGNSEKDLIRRLKMFNSTLIHLDDHGDGGTLADLVIQSLYENPKDLTKEQYVFGPLGYIPTKKAVYKNNNTIQDPRILS